MPSRGTRALRPPAPGFRAFERRGLLDSFLSLSGGEVAARVVAFLGTVYLARRLGVEGFGVVGFATALCTYLAIAVNAGFNALGAREVARRPDQARAIAGGVVIVRLALSVAAVLATALLASILPKPDTVRLVVVLTSFSFLTLALDTRWVYQGLGRNRPVGWALTLAQLLYVLGLFAWVHGPEDIFWVPVAQIGGELGAALWLGLPLARSPGEPAAIAEGIRLLRLSGPLLLSRVLRTLIYTFDIVLLGFLLGEEPVGLYSAAYRFSFLALAVGLALHAAYLPHFARTSSRDREALARITQGALGSAWSLAVPMLAGGIVLANPLLVNLFGAEYGAAAAALRWLLGSIGLVYLHGIFHNLFLTIDWLRQEMWIMAAAAALNIGLNFWWIPRFGLTGAAAATVAAESLVLFGSAWLAARWVRRPWPANLLRVPLAATVMAGLLAWWSAGGLWPRLAAGVVIYTAVLAVLRGLPADLTSE